MNMNMTASSKVPPMRTQGLFRRRLFRLLQRLDGLRFDRSGNALIIFAVALPVVAGSVGLSVEAGSWFQTKRQGQTAADAAAISGAIQLARQDTAGVVYAATREAQRNGFSATGGASIQIHTPPTSGPNTANATAVEVIVTQPQKLFLSGLFLTDGLNVASRSVAAAESIQTACVLSLDPSASSGILITGSTVVAMPGCAMAANSSNAAAISISGNGQLDVATLWTAGGYAVAGSGTLTTGSPPITDAWALPDPYKNLTIVAPSNCNANNASFRNTTTTINPGVYCGGMNFGAHAVVALNPGTYYINGGDIDIAAQATIICNCSHPGDGVTFVLTNTSNPSQTGTVTINGGAQVRLNAPSAASDPYRGLLFVQNRAASSVAVAKFTGGASQTLTGAIYFPNQPLKYSGNSTTTTPNCIEVIARTVTMTGNSTLDSSACAAYDVKLASLLAAHLAE